MINVNVVQWRGNKDVSLFGLKMSALPRIEDYIEFPVHGKLVKGKVTRVTHKFETDGDGDLSIVTAEVRINMR